MSNEHHAFKDKDWRRLEEFKVETEAERLAAIQAADDEYAVGGRFGTSDFKKLPSYHPDSGQRVSNEDYDDAVWIGVQAFLENSWGAVVDNEVVKMSKKHLHLLTKDNQQ